MLTCPQHDKFILSYIFIIVIIGGVPSGVP
jgi:hypothetical protein